jgi:predicted permease
MAPWIRPRIRRAFHLALRRHDLTDAEIDEELRTHVELRVAQLIARGLTREQAEAEARRRFGASWTDAVRRVHDAAQAREGRLAMRERLDAWRSDAAYAVRTLGRQPAFALIVVLTFALGIGANATMFGVIDGLLLRPPPQIVRPDEIIELGQSYTYHGAQYFSGGYTYPFYTALRSDTADFTGVAASYEQRCTLGSGADAEEVRGSLVSAGYFDVLGTRPLFGRFFLSGEGRESGGDHVVVLSHAFWERRFGGSRDVLGKALHLGAAYFTVIGVAPPGFTGPKPNPVDVWIPLGSADGMQFAGSDWATTWDSMWLDIYVRPRPGVSVSAVVARARLLYARARSEWLVSKGRPPNYDPPRIEARSILPAEQMRGHPEAKVSRLLAVVTAVVLLIACANVANLLLARGAQRRREIAVRLALGVSRTRLLRLLLSETIVLSVLGGAIAAGVAAIGVRVTHATLLTDYAWVEPTLDGRVLAVTALLVVATVLVAGLMPAIRASRPNVVETIKTGGREGSVRQSRTRIALLVIQAALSALLLVGAGLFVNSLREVARIHLGYEPSRVVGATMDLRPLGYKQPDRIALFNAMRDRVAATRGIESAAIAATHPLSGSAFATSFRIPGRDSLPQSPLGGPYFNRVSGDYFATLGLRIVDGRPITSADVASDARVVVLSESLARAYWPNERAVGQCMILDADSTCSTVVGVAEDAKEQVTAGAARFIIYTRLGPGYDGNASVLVARASGRGAATLVPAIRKAMQSAAPNLPYADVRTFEQMLAPQTRSWRMGATLFTLFGVLALLIAAVGLYSAISYGVTQRRHEFGVRMALGARVDDIVGLVLGQGVRAAVAGVVIGLGVALAAGGMVADLLFQTSPRNPLVFGAVAVVIVLVAVAATFVPAWRASRVDPVAALRAE